MLTSVFFLSLSASIDGSLRRPQGIHSVRAGKLPDSGDAADYAGAVITAQRRGGNAMKSSLLIAVMAIVTILLRFIPFLMFRKHTPQYILYLGKVLPQAIIGMLVVFCLKDISPSGHLSGIPELTAVACVAGAQAWKRNSLLSILSGTVVYMLLIQVVF